MKTEQFNVWIDSGIISLVEQFSEKYGVLFPKQGKKARVAEAVLEAGVKNLSEELKDELEKIKNQKK